MQEGTYTPPLYLDLYNFHDGAQNDIFENTTDTSPSSAFPASTFGSAIQAAQATQNSSLLSQGTPTPLSGESLPAVQIPSHASAPEGASSTSGAAVP
jgi:lytic polysaccharide monooxygenase AA14-like protein